MAAGLVHLDRRLLVEAEQAEGHQEHVQQAGVVRVLDVLEHQLPVAGNALAHVAEHDELAAVEHAVEIAQHAVAEIGLERLVRRAEAGEHDAVPLRRREALQAVVLGAEIGRHAALAAIAAAERHAEQVAVEIVGPLVIGADELLRRAAAGGAELHAAMGAAVDQHVDRAVGTAHGDDLAVAELAALEVAGVGDLGFEADIEPVGPPKMRSCSRAKISGSV